MNEAEMHAADIERVKREQKEAFEGLLLRYMAQEGIINLFAEAYLMGERNEKERVK